MRQAVKCGVTAFRFASEIWIAYLDAMKTALAELPHNCPDARLVYAPARVAAKAMILERIEQLGCAGKAW